MKYIIIILFAFVSVIATAQDILESEREPIIVETKADLQTELELLPIKYLRDERPDSLLKFNYSYHGNPLNGDFFLFPEGRLTNYLNLNSGTHDLFEVTNNLFLNEYTLNLNYLHRQDKGERKISIFSLGNTYSFDKHNFELSAEYLDSHKKTSLLSSDNETKNISLSYSLNNSEVNFINKVLFKGQFEKSSVTLINKDRDYWNLFSELELEPLNSFFTDIKFANNHKAINTQIQAYYENYLGLGLWSGITQDKAIIAPYLNYYLNYHNLSLKLTNKPYSVQQSYYKEFQKHLYGTYDNIKTDYLVPGNAFVELSYFKYLTWTIGSHYLYVVNEPIYRFETLTEGINFDSYWKTSHYAKATYQSKSLNISSKGELIDYKNFNSEFLPFVPEFRITNSLAFNFKKLSVGADYILESKARDDYENKLDDSHIINAYANYQLNNKVSFWSEITNLLNKNSNNYLQDQINQTELKAGLKLFF